MIKLHDQGVYLSHQYGIVPEEECANPVAKDIARKGTIAWSILSSHNISGDDRKLKIKFDSMASHDITFVGIIQTAKASGMTRFLLPYVLTNCHNSLCAVGGTINSDDHIFGLTSAQKYGGIYVPPHISVIHQYMREMMAGCGQMILGSDSHTRYGALGTMAVGEGGGELVKQLLGNTWDIDYPEVVAVYLTGKPAAGVGPQDIALALIGAVFKKGYVKNKVMEFVGPGVASMSTDYRNSIDVMTTETTCLSSIWQTDEETKKFLRLHGREKDYRALSAKDMAYYDGCIEIDLSTIRPMIALPFHPANVYEIDTLNQNLPDILREVEIESEKISLGRAKLSLLDKIENGKLRVQQGIIAGCSGGNYVNVAQAAQALKHHACGDNIFSLSVYPSSQPVLMALNKKGLINDLMSTGAIVRTAFCGPCFGAGDTPMHNGLSIRHTTRNFPNREGSKPGNGQMSAVALMDARSIAATAINGGLLTSAAELDCWQDVSDYEFDVSPYKSRVYQGFVKGVTQQPLIYGPNIKDWPEMNALTENILLVVAAKIMDPVTTTDELIPSGETSSFRSNPLGLAEFTLSRRDPEYVGRSKAIAAMEQQRVNGEDLYRGYPQLENIFSRLRRLPGQEHITVEQTEIGSMVYAVKPGDGSAREQAASCQRVLGGLANICQEYATKRYRSNVINWGMLPLQMKQVPDFEVGDFIYIPAIKSALAGDLNDITAFVLSDKKPIQQISLYMEKLTADEQAIIQAGGLINYNKNQLTNSH
ncbi:TPA: hydratase [Klebsiella quasipneumoniae]|uniref:hydratase n=1 Tax=Klebsiella quasipneumoniae TaxID=1463165 RepID=UPI000E2C0582|nr:hydratase [Klebsiella quasipneumoniae]MDH2671410.1 hydratase [Klebsiella quasipneumoniae]SXD25179.1 aconitate hydratase domain-containing protein [Klebsiella quasipneumoniae]HBR1814964.1 hydratase [Klebsiella quasipneumoniae subsp. similipneumoniae]